jgi:hypothetical protein
VSSTGEIVRSRMDSLSSRMLEGKFVSLAATASQF